MDDNKDAVDAAVWVCDATLCDADVAGFDVCVVGDVIRCLVVVDTVIKK